MAGKVSAIINTFNEEKNIARAINSVKWADEIIVCDMYSEDDTVKIVKKLGARVVFHKRVGYVEPARNFAISKASSDWVLILDADEEISDSLAKRLQGLVSKPINSQFVEIPRKNIIFGKWMRASMWWPDYQIRFFKKGHVFWQNKIHSKPKTSGQGLTLPSEEKWAIIHHNYQTISQFIDRMNRYTSIQAEQLRDQKYKFVWKDLMNKPASEFLSRFFAHKGYEDGLHGLSLSLLQAFSHFIVYLRLWEISRFKEEDINLSELEDEKNKSAQAINYWIKQYKLPKNPFKRFLQKFTI